MVLISCTHSHGRGAGGGTSGRRRIREERGKGREESRELRTGGRRGEKKEVGMS